MKNSQKTPIGGFFDVVKSKEWHKRGQY